MEIDIRDHINRVKSGERGLNPFIDFIGIKLLEAENGRCVMELEVREEFYQGAFVVQGGLMGALSDEAMAYAVLSKLREPKNIATVSITHQHIKAVKNGTLRAEANVVKMGRNIAFVEAKVFNIVKGSQKLVLTSSSTFIIM